MIENFSDRHHPFDGCFNFRDIGGYQTEDGGRVRWGRYFRAGRQDRMTERDLTKLRSMGIRAQIDLRRPDEASEQGRGPLSAEGARYHNIAVIPDGGSDQLSQLVGDTGISGKRYLGYLSFGPESWQRMFDIFASADGLPLLIHCTAGKDRTGVATAFLLSVLGVGREIIEADYLLTNRDVERQVTFLERAGLLPEGVTADDMIHAAGVPETAMHDFLDGLDAEYGGALSYLEGIGITQDIQARIKLSFLERS